MLMLISPAKTLDYESPLATQSYSHAELLPQAQQLAEIAAALTPAELGQLMKISDKLAGLNAARFAQWTPDITPQTGRAAVLAFKGDVYTGLDAERLSEADFEYAQSHLRILSGLYGVLKPLDLMLPYRLEMGTRLANPKGKDLYAFWGEQITEVINRAVAQQGDNLLINLASNEYFKSVKSAKLQANLITPVFKDLKNGQYKVISFYAKKARGMMVRYLIENRVTELEQLQQFDSAGYTYSRDLSTPDSPVFLRDTAD